MGLRNERFQVHAPPELLEQIRERARARRVPAAVVVREALELYLDAAPDEVAEYFDPTVQGARWMNVGVAKTGRGV